jgi:serine/threonine protein kinase
MEIDPKPNDFSQYESHFAILLSAHGYILNCKIGAGGQAVVYLCESIRGSGTYAIKVGEQEDEHSIPAELQALQAVWNPHVINVYETFIDDGFRFMVLEYCPGGSLYDMVNSGPIPMDRLWGLGKQVIDALIACHQQGIAHLDIKPQNILLDKLGRAKLCDFGLASRVDIGCLSEQFKGSIAFLAPEILRKQHYDPFKADVWSLGVTFYVCASGHLPWPTKAAEFFAGVSRGLSDVDDDIPLAFGDLLRRMIVPDPSARCQLEELTPIFEQKCELSAKSQRFPSQYSLSRPHLTRYLPQLKQGGGPSMRRLSARATLGCRDFESLGAMLVLVRGNSPVPTRPTLLKPMASFQQKEDLE